MSKQVLDIKQMMHLRELGLDTSNASMALIYENSYGDVVDWEIADGQIHKPSVGEYNPYLRSRYGAFTLQDILDLLPGTIIADYFGVNETYWLEMGAGERNKSYWFVQYRSISDHIYEITKENELIDAAYKMLCSCVEDGYISK